jgi:anaerobic magnesium-protoporphyrin IX monomethyl ester cyclase
MAKRADLDANLAALAEFRRLGMFVQAGHILFGHDGLLHDAEHATAGTAGLGNHAYTVADPAARIVYTALKRWQRSHARIYDQTIDPLSAPKAIDPYHRTAFGDLSIELRRADLRFFRAALDLDGVGGTEAEAIEFTDEHIATGRDWYARLAARAEQTYRAASLIYDTRRMPAHHPQHRLDPRQRLPLPLHPLLLDDRAGKRHGLHTRNRGSRGRAAGDQRSGNGQPWRQRTTVH